MKADCVASVRSTGKVMELREDIGSWVSRRHGKECRERIRVAIMCDDAGQQKLRTTEERLAPAASAARAEAAQEGQASPARVDVAQESRDEEMNEACATNNGENVQPRIDESWDDSTEIKPFKRKTVTRHLEDHWYRPR